MADTASLIVRVNSQGVAETAKQLDTLTGSSNRAGTATTNLGNNSQKAVPKMNALRASIGNAGYQVQDFIVQIQGGQSALVAFTQQGSQLVSAFNPIAGTLLTIAAVAGGALYNGLNASTNAAEDLAKSVDALDSVVEEASPGVFNLNTRLEELNAIGATAEERVYLINAALAQTKQAAEQAGAAALKAVEELANQQSFISTALTAYGSGATNASGRGVSDPVEALLRNRARASGLAVEELKELDRISAGLKDGSVTIDQAAAYVRTLEAQGKASKLALDQTGLALTNLSATNRKITAQATGIAKSEETFAKSQEDRAQREIERQNRIGAAASARAARQIAADLRAQESAQKQADQFIATLDRNSGTELQRIDATEQQKLAKLQEYRDQQLVGDQQYEESKSAIQAEFQAQRDALYLNAGVLLEKLQSLGNTEFEEIQRQNDAKLEQLNDLLARQLISQEEYAAAVAGISRQMVIDQTNASANAFGSIASDAKSAFGEASAAYKAFAITQATIATYTGAIEAYKSTAAIPIVGPFLAPVAAGLAIAAGTANIAKISGAREQGGQLNAGGDYLVGERGPEIIRAGSAARALSASDSRREQSGNGGANGNITIVNNTSSQIGSVRQEEDEVGRLRIIIEEQVAASLQNNNSKISKARKATRGAPGFK